MAKFESISPFSRTNLEKFIRNEPEDLGVEKGTSWIQNKRATASTKTWCVLDDKVHHSWFCAVITTCADSRRIAELILNLGTRWRWEVNLTLRPLYRLVEITGTQLIEASVDPAADLQVLGKEKIMFELKNMTLQNEAQLKIVNNLSFGI